MKEKRKKRRKPPKLDHRRRRKIVGAVRKFWDSLDTHLDYTNDPFHKKTSQEYVEAMKDLIDTL